ncbi:uncharacterized protein [Drosophila pseudoobscura]|uniref:DUF3472 domain-containing protein n=1 Tax=Drosophila pseudoobscura pseudoobscura TaxID=46245 RepID=A0A6I8UII3_DROPS|nr:uncharacterized protein LOC4816495 [Drosophila pseudoobscura]
MNPPKPHLFCLLVLAVSLTRALGAHPSPEEAQEDMARFMRVLRHSSRFNDVLGNSKALINYQDYGFSGIRGIFQWMAGEDKRNDGIYNFLQFFSDQAGGYIGLQNYDKSSKYTVLFSVWDATGAEPGQNFDCSTFGGEGIGYKCFDYDFDLISNAIYYLDVEIDGPSIRGYISEPQEDLVGATNPQVPRQLIGNITWPGKQSNLIPFAYYNENYRDKDSCKRAFELVTVNQAPRQYTARGQAATSFSEAYLYSSQCEVENILVALTADKQSTIYFTRPTIR